MNARHSWLKGGEKVSGVTSPVNKQMTTMLTVLPTVHVLHCKQHCLATQWLCYKCFALQAALSPAPAFPPSPALASLTQSPLYLATTGGSALQAALSGISGLQCVALNAPLLCLFLAPSQPPMQVLCRPLINPSNPETHP
jgi:hypothetical protein